eukprot:3004999-Prymnesium_polylepis.1
MPRACDTQRVRFTPHSSGMGAGCAHWEVAPPPSSSTASKLLSPMPRDRRRCWRAHGGRDAAVRRR